MSKLIIVSNRLPISVRRRRGDLEFIESVGGLATGLRSLGGADSRTWVGWPGLPVDEVSPKQRGMIARRLSKESCHPVFLARDLIRGFYGGFSNGIIWPLFHYFSQYAVYRESRWIAYEKANEKFRDAVLEIAEPGDYVWIHDYHLMLLPRLLRRELSDVRIGFFLHIPFPSFELFRTLPWREEIIKGLVGADLIGFHTDEYARHFLETTERVLGVKHSRGVLNIGDRSVRTGAFPMGIDYDRFADAGNDPAVRRRAAGIRRKVGDRKIVLSVDRLDYSKGIIERLEAFEAFLSEYPEYKDKVTLIVIAAPSRSRVTHYARLRDHIEGLVGRINGEHGTMGWVPVWYMYRSEPFERLVALYSVADVALVTPLRDGMNLIAKEAIATKSDGRVVLILSETAGAANELSGAVIVNTRNRRAIVAALRQALEMPEEEQIERCTRMQNHLRLYTVHRWAESFMNSLVGVTPESVSGRVEESKNGVSFTRNSGKGR